ncbi:V-type ATP synthase subunit B [Ekhidna sp.]|uniref:V-type ATP synthase subunit B n=1 Tax=Ekhidna sp. TaxID=2608089 RepID=UPI003B50D181
MVKANEVRFGELAWVNDRPSQAISVVNDQVTLQVFGGTEGLSTHSHVVFTGKPPTLPVSDLLAGRFLNALGQPIDNGSPIKGEERIIKGATVNPVSRAKPDVLLATGIAGIDLNNTLVTGQKIPFFADPDQPYNQVMADVALRAEADKIILGGMGLSNDDYLFFKNTFESAGVLDKIVCFINTSEDPSLERLLIPDMACTAAEYFANDKQEKVLLLLTDMTLYADALATVANKMDQIPSKDSMPGSLYSDLASIYEKAVQFEHGGSITMIAVTTLNDGDITHAIPDNTGYITEGQLYLKHDTEIGKVIVDPFRSLSRLKQNVIGKKTREDHPQVMNALIRLYADAMDARTKKENGFDLNDYDIRCLAFAKDYALQLLAVDINIPIDEMLDTGWDLLQTHFEAYEVGIKDEFLNQYWKKEKAVT